MNAPIVEIFSSIQGEGLLIGRRQIFIRFAGCNLNCNYCDTQESQYKSNGIILSTEDVFKKIEDLKTPDLHSISFTGGEPLLYINFINEIIENIDFKSFLETNGTLTDNIKKLKNIDYVSLDIKLPEHFDLMWDEKIFEDEINSLKILIECNTNVYCKLVVSPSTKLTLVEKVVKRLSNEINSYGVNIPLIIQPMAPINQWKNLTTKLFEFSEVVGKYMDVLLIPQMHKILNIE